MLLQQIRGEWFNSFSSLLAFCNTDPEAAAKVKKFQHVLVRLQSLLYASALVHVTSAKWKVFELIDVEAFDKEHMMYMQNSPEPCKVVLQWIQRLIVESDTSGAIKIAPPILSRIFNQLGNGIVQLNHAKAIKKFPIPFPLAQMLTLMLLLYSVATAIVTATTVETLHWAGALTFMVTLAYWSVYYIALELEMPYGFSLHSYGN